jgi:hypothetical protein
MQNRKLFCSLMLGGAALTLWAATAAAQSSGTVVIRVDDTSGAHCIDASSEKVTVFVRRVFTERKKGWFSSEQTAGVRVRTLSPEGAASGQALSGPSAQVVSVSGDEKGRISLGMEYGVASGYVLNSGNGIADTMSIDVTLPRTKVKKGFFGRSKDTSPEQIAHIDLKFNEIKEADLARCKSAGYERTGALAVMQSSGAPGANLLPVTNTEQEYCFRYSSGSTYELLAAKRKAEDGSCPAPSEFQAVKNNYVLMLINAQKAK